MRFAEGFEFGDVGFVELRHMRRGNPAAMQVLAGHAADFAERLGVGFTEAAEVDAGLLRQTEFAAGGGRRCSHDFLHVTDDVLSHDALLAPGAGNLREVDAKFARQFAHRRAGIETTLSRRRFQRMRVGGGHADG